MVRPAFEDVDVDLWVHPRKLGVTQPSVCLFHDRPDAGVQIFDALVELAGETRPAQRTITFKACLRPYALHKMRLKIESIGDDLKVMHVGLDCDSVTITMTDEGLLLLKNALTNWLVGGEDFGVSPGHSDLKPKDLGNLDKESGELWFWGPGYAGP